MNLTLETPLGNTDIILQRDGLATLRDIIQKNHPKNRIVILTDDNLWKLYGEELSNTFKGHLSLLISSGEESKKLSNVEILAEKMLDAGITRSDVMIGFGGGIVTDLAGFLASIYMRGMTYIAVPTSLLCMIDASIGGKTGVDTTAKNILGTFYPAENILIDPDFLEELPARQFQIGMAEIIKYAAIFDASLAEDLSHEKINIDTILKKSIRAKTMIVNQDVKEKGIRKALNFGHTFGHAVEQLSNYKLSHGEAISIGMMLANKVAQNLDKQSPETGEKIRKLLERFSLPTTLPDYISPSELVEMIKRDKKRHGDKISFILSTNIGKHEIVELGAEELMKLAFR